MWFRINLIIFCMITGTAPLVYGANQTHLSQNDNLCCNPSIWSNWFDDYKGKRYIFNNVDKAYVLKNKIELSNQVSLCSHTSGFELTGQTERQCYFDKVLYPRDKSIFGLIQKDKKIDCRISSYQEYQNEKTLNYGQEKQKLVLETVILKADDCYIPDSENDIEEPWRETKRFQAQIDKTNSNYVSLAILSNDIDCNPKYDNKQKQSLLQILYNDKRVIFSGKISSAEAISKEIILKNTPFQSPPQLTLIDRSEFPKIQENRQYSFDCRIAQSCQTNLYIFKDGMKFDDCIFLKYSPKNLPINEVDPIRGKRYILKTVIVEHGYVIKNKIILQNRAYSCPDFLVPILKGNACYVSHELTPRDKSIFGIIQPNNKYNLDCKIVDYSIDEHGNLFLITNDCFIPNAPQKRSKLQKWDKKKVDKTNIYVPAEFVQEKLDCDGEFDNDEKQAFLDYFSDKRVMFYGKILSTDSIMKKVVISQQQFKGSPKISLANNQDRSAFAILQDEVEYLFDCQIRNYCKDGGIFQSDGELIFDNCRIFEIVHKSSLKEFESTFKDRQRYLFENILVKRADALEKKIYLEKQNYSCPEKFRKIGICHFPSVLIPRDSSIFSLIQAKNNKIDCRITFFSVKNDNEFSLEVEDCFIPNETKERDSALDKQSISILSDYISLDSVRNHFDCGGKYSNRQKQYLLKLLYDNKRVIFSGEISSADAISKEIILKKTPFKSSPQLTFVNRSKFSEIRENMQYDFDCKIANPCQTSSYFFKTGMKFDDCIFLKSSSKNLPINEIEPILGKHYVFKNVMIEHGYLIKNKIHLQEETHPCPAAIKSVANKMCYFDPDLTPKNKSIFGLIQKNHKYDIDCRIASYYFDKTDKLVFKTNDCFIPNASQKQSKLPQWDKKKVDKTDIYVSAEFVKEKLDCDGAFDNEEKQAFLHFFSDKRVMFYSKILSADSIMKRIVIDSQQQFTGFPEINLTANQDRSAFAVLQDKVEYLFDCKIRNFCKDGGIFQSDGELIFDNCRIFKKIPKNSLKEFESTFKDRQRYLFENILVKRSDALNSKIYLEEETYPCPKFISQTGICYLPSVLIPRDSSIFAVIQENNKIDCRITDFFVKGDNEFSLKVEDCYIPNVEIHSALDKKSSSYHEYVQPMVVRKELDCDGTYSNKEKEELLQKYANKRVKFKSKIKSAEAIENLIRIDTKFFQGSPKVILRNKVMFSNIRKNQKHLFDCRISNYCEDGWFQDKELTFDDCLIQKK